MQESEPVFAYQFLEVFPKLSSKLRKYAKGNRAWDKLKHCCKPFKQFKMSLPSRKVCFRNLHHHMWGEVFHGSVPMFFHGPRIPSVAFKEQQPTPQVAFKCKKGADLLQSINIAAIMAKLAN